MQKEAENEEKEIARKELGKERVEKEKECQTKGKRVGGQFTVTQLGQLKAWETERAWIKAAPRAWNSHILVMNPSDLTFFHSANAASIHLATCSPILLDKSKSK